MMGLRSTDVEQAMLAGQAATTSPAAQRTLMQAQSYLLMRRTVGYAGAALPTVLFVVELILLDGGFTVRDSLSAYYHSGARDLFVATLCVVSLTLSTYLASQPASWQFVLSLIAGASGFVVALVPTRLPDGTATVLTPLQRRLGEDTAYGIHLGAAAIFILTLGVLCFVTASADRRLAAEDVAAATLIAPTITLQRACGATILMAVGWVLVGVDLGPFTPLYVGEVVAVYAFAASWILRSRTLARLLLVY